MKIVHVTQFFHPQRGYQENNLVKKNFMQGHKVTVLCSDTLAPWGERRAHFSKLDIEFSRKYNVKITRLRIVFDISRRLFVKGLKAELDIEKPDLVIVHGITLPMSIIAMSWASKESKYLIVDDHMVQAGSKNKLSGVFHFLFRYLFPLYLKLLSIHVSKWVAVSDETKNLMINNYGIKDAIHVVPLGYDNKNVYRDIEGGNRWLQENGLQRNVKYLLYIGKIDANKNPGDLLEAFKIFRKDNKSYRLLVVGDPCPSYMKILKNKIAGLELVDHVDIRDSVHNDEIRKVFSIAQAAIWPHGSSMAMLEAMACFCVVIAPNIPVNQERLKEGRGIIFQENSNRDLLKALWIAKDEKEFLTKNANVWVEKFSWSVLEKDFMEI